MAITSTNPAASAGGYQNIARAISAYGQQAFTDAVRLAGTDLVGGSVTLGGSQIVSESEDFYGTIRWDKAADDVAYLNTGTSISGSKTRINIATETATEGEFSEFEMDVLEYIKTYRTHGAEDFLVTQVLTRRGGAIQKIGENFGRTRAQDADMALVSVLKGVIGAEVRRAKGVGVTDALRTEDSGAFGIREGNMLPETGGFYYDVNYRMAQGAAGTGTLIAPKATGGSTKGAGAITFEEVLKAQTYGFSDVEVPFMYLIVDPRTYLEIQLANLLDEDHVTDGNVQFRTVLGGAYRLMVTRTSLGDFATPASTISTANGYGHGSNVTAARAAINSGSTRTSVLARPDSVAFVPMGVNRPVAFDRDESTGRGAGRDEMWMRWGFVMHPYGYTWSGYKGAFARNDDLGASVTDAVFGGNSSNKNRGYSGEQNWQRKEAPGNLRVLPIFHA